MAMNKPILGNEVIRQLREAGIIGPRVRRVIIDASFDSVAKLYVEYLIDESAFKLDISTLQNSEVITVAKPEEITKVTPAGTATPARESVPEKPEGDNGGIEERAPAAAPVDRPMVK